MDFLKCVTTSQTHHKTRDHETSALRLGLRVSRRRKTVLYRKLNTEDGTVFVTYLRWNVRIGFPEAAKGGETFLADCDRTGSGHQARHIGDVPLSEYVEQLFAVVADLQVFREGRQQIKGEDGLHRRFKHRRVHHNSSSCPVQRRDLFQFVRWV